MGKSFPTVRSLAQELGVSRATVSKVMRGEGRISQATRDRVLAAARAADYRPNPLAAHLMSEMRRSRGNFFRGILAAIVVADRRKEKYEPFTEEILVGARGRAKELGFKVEEFVLGIGNLSITRLDGILHSRGVNGVLFLPSWHSPDFAGLNWNNYAGIYTDRNPCEPALHVVCSDHYSSMISLLKNLYNRGYRHFGLFTEAWRDERLQGRRQAAFHAFEKSHPDVVPVPPLITSELDRVEFCKWFRKWQPDVVIGHFTETISWMESCGARVPSTHGFVTLNVVYQKRATAGIDQQPREIGMRAAEQVIAQLQRNERGAPSWPTTTAILARWVDGPTVRKMEPNDAPLPRKKKRTGLG